MQNLVFFALIAQLVSSGLHIFYTPKKETSWIGTWTDYLIELRTPRGYVQDKAYAMYCVGTTLGVAAFVVNQVLLPLPRSSYWQLLVLFVGSCLLAGIQFAFRRRVTLNLKHGTYEVAYDSIGIAERGDLTDMLMVSRSVTACLLYLKSGRRIWLGTYATKKEAEELAARLAEAINIPNEAKPIWLPWMYPYRLDF